ncbi:MAG: methylenetetrahydrofolate--tRNA-(uracil(54)-C(5))-methyltransferase (FADH(2)-oxidizing) TrmFO, partial [bacterium]
MEPICIIGGGLAGCEAAWQAANLGVPAALYEMRPARTTPAHTTDWLAELVCSNSLKSASPTSAPGILKEELRLWDSVVMSAAEATRVPAGQALAVDRERFAQAVTGAVEGHPLITVHREEVDALPAEGPAVVATGPLTSEAMSEALAELMGSEFLYFYDAISPIVDGESIDYEVAYFASRYGKGGVEDYLNCPLTDAEYDAFYDALVSGETYAPHAFEEALFFEGCLPIEEMA